MVKRCRYTVIDDFTKRTRLCKKNKKYMDYCYTHSYKVYNKNVIKIQSTYRAYRVRKKSKIYYKLPDDLQRKILYYVNQNIYNKWYNDSVANIIYNRCIKFCYNPEFQDILNSRFDIFIFNFQQNIEENENNEDLEFKKLIKFRNNLYELINIIFNYKDILKFDKLSKNLYNYKLFLLYNTIFYIGIDNIFII